MKKIFKSFICLFIFIFLVSSNSYAYSKEDEMEKFNEDFIELLDKTSTDYHYNFLGTLKYGFNLQYTYLELDKVFLECITNYEKNTPFVIELENLSEMISKIENSDELNEYIDNAKYVLEAYKRDHPLMYFIHEANIGWDYYSGVPVNLCVYSLDEYSPSQKYEYNKIIYQKVIEYCSYTEGIDSEYTKSRILNKLICDNMYYEYDSSGNPSPSCSAHSALGFFLYGKGVCESYAYAFSALMNYSGVECLYVCGNLNFNTNKSHAWNIARLNNGEWYWYDIDQNDDDKKGLEQREYLAFNDNKDSVTNAPYYTNIYFSYISVPKLSQSTDNPEDWYTLTYDDVLYEIENDKLYILDNPKQNEIPEKIELKWRNFTTHCIHDELVDKDNCKMCVKCLQFHTAISKSRYVEPTCTKDGKTVETTCSYCNCVLEKGEVIPATGHTLSEWIVDVEPTKDVYGYRHTECLTCKEIIEEERIPKLKGCQNKVNSLYSLLTISNILFLIIVKKVKIWSE